MQALECFGEVLDIVYEKHGHEHVQVARVLCHIGDIHYRLGDHDKALDLLAESIAMSKRTCPNFDDDHSDDQSICWSLNTIGKIYDERLWHDKALVSYQDALAHLIRTPAGKKDPCVCMLHESIANNNFLRGDFQEALKMYHKVLKIKRRVVGNDHVDVASILNNIGLIHSCQGRHDKAQEMMEEALGMYIRNVCMDHGDVASIHLNIAACKAVQGNKEEAADDVKEARRILSKLNISHGPLMQRVFELMTDLEIHSGYNL